MEGTPGDTGDPVTTKLYKDSESSGSVSSDSDTKTSGSEGRRPAGWTDDALSAHAEMAFATGGGTTGKIFVGGLAWDTTEDELRDFFSGYGQIAEVLLPTNKHTGAFRCFAFLRFTEPVVSEAVVATRHTLRGRVLDVRRALRPEEIIKVRSGARPGATRSSAEDGGAGSTELSAASGGSLKQQDAEGAESVAASVESASHTASTDHDSSSTRSSAPSSPPDAPRIPPLDISGTKDDQFTSTTATTTTTSSEPSEGDTTDAGTTDSGAVPTQSGSPAEGASPPASPEVDAEGTRRSSTSGLQLSGGHRRSSAGAEMGGRRDSGGGARSVALGRSRSDDEADPRRIFVGGLSIYVHDMELYNYFEQFGMIESATVVVHHDTMMSRRFGFVTFVHREGAQLALRKPNHWLMGKRAEVKPAQPASVMQAQAAAAPSLDGSASPSTSSGASPVQSARGGRSARSQASTQGPSSAREAGGEAAAAEEGRPSNRGAASNRGGSGRYGAGGYYPRGGDQRYPPHEYPQSHYPYPASPYYAAPGAGGPAYVVAPPSVPGVYAHGGPGLLAGQPAAFPGGSGAAPGGPLHGAPYGHPTPPAGFADRFSGPPLLPAAAAYGQGAPAGAHTFPPHPHHGAPGGSWYPAAPLPPGPPPPGASTAPGALSSPYPGMQLPFHPSSIAGGVGYYGHPQYPTSGRGSESPSSSGGAQMQAGFAPSASDAQAPPLPPQPAYGAQMAPPAYHGFAAPLSHHPQQHFGGAGAPFPAYGYYGASSQGSSRTGSGGAESPHGAAPLSPGSSSASAVQSAMPGTIHQGGASATAVSGRPREGSR